MELGFPANETFREKMQKFSFAFRKLFHENKSSENEANFHKMQNFRENAKRENLVKTMSVKAATINCSKELVEFSALIPQYLKF